MPTRYAEDAEATCLAIRREVLPLLAGDTDALIEALADLEDVLTAWTLLRDDVRALVLSALPFPSLDLGGCSLQLVA